MIIEINDTGNPYFERAVLYLKDNHVTASKKSVEAEAQNYMSNMKTAVATEVRRPAIISSILKLILSAAFGAFVTLLLVTAL